MDLKFDKITILYLSIETLKIPKMLFDGHGVYLQHTLNSVCIICFQRITFFKKYVFNPSGKCDEGDELVDMVNPFMLNGFSHLYQLEKFISSFRIVGWWYFSLYSNFNGNNL